MLQRVVQDLCKTVISTLVPHSQVGLGPIFEEQTRRKFCFRCSARHVSQSEGSKLGLICEARTRRGIVPTSFHPTTLLCLSPSPTSLCVCICVPFYLACLPAVLCFFTCTHPLPANYLPLAAHLTNYLCPPTFTSAPNYLTLPVLLYFLVAISVYLPACTPLSADTCGSDKLNCASAN